MPEAARCGYTMRPLANQLDLTEKRLFMQITRTCSVPGCGRAHRARGWCAAHYMRVRNLGHPGAVDVGQPVHLTPPFEGEDHPNWVGDQITYHGAHLRVRANRGKASGFGCQHCDADARHWAYDHNDPNELRAPDGKRYSPLPEHYLPLCVPCHSRFDAEARVST